MFDKETGEFDGELRGENSQQEVLPPGKERAANGDIVRTESRTAGQFVDMLEDGQLSEDLQAELAQVVGAMNHITENTGAKTKGEVTLTIKLSKEGEHLEIQTAIKSKSPELPRPKSVVWDAGNGNFCRFPPNQSQMFGTRRAVRTV